MSTLLRFLLGFAKLDLVPKSWEMAVLVQFVNVVTVNI